MHADRAILSALALASVLASAPAAACTLTITTGGALDLSDDHTQLGNSDGAGELRRDWVGRRYSDGQQHLFPEHLDLRQ